MRVTILRERELEIYSPALKSLLISIRDPGDSVVYPQGRYRAVLALVFEDVDRKDAATEGRIAFGPADAEAIRELVEGEDGIEEIVVHSKADYSRSPAVALALAEWLDPSRVERIRTYYRGYNRAVYSILREHLEDRGLVRPHSLWKRVRMAFRRS